MNLLDFRDSKKRFDGFRMVHETRWHRPYWVVRTVEGWAVLMPDSSTLPIGFVVAGTGFIQKSSIKIMHNKNVIYINKTEQ